MEHLVNDLLHCRLQAWTFPAGIEARWLGEGILQLLPTAPWRRPPCTNRAAWHRLTRPPWWPCASGVLPRPRPVLAVAS